MIQLVYTVRDNKVEAYLRPFFVRSAGEAERAFSDTVNDPKSALYQHPHDFALYFLGKYDDESGKFVTDAPVHMCNAIEVRRETFVPNEEG